METPLGEASEAYRIDILDGFTVVRSVTTLMPSFTYPAAQQTADFGVAAGGDRRAGASGERDRGTRRSGRAGIRILSVQDPRGLGGAAELAS